MEPLLLSLPANRVRRNYRGGKQLDQLEGKLNPTDSDRPEDWIASTVAARNPGLTEIANEGLAFVTALNGKPVLLRDLFAANPEHYLGAKHFASLGVELGFLVKLLDSSMRLHVQAHPTAAFAQKFLNSRWGKLETYVILSVRPECEGYIRLGFQRPPSAAEWRRIILEQDIPAMDGCFDCVRVQPGEVWVVPGAMPHAIGEGLLVLETMEPTDLVVRCEFEREGIVVPPPARFMGRDPDFALQIFDYTPNPEPRIRSQCRIAPAEIERGDGFVRERLIGPEQTDCFQIERLTVGRAATVAKTQAVHVGVVADGAGQVVVGSESVGLKPGAKFLVAAAAGNVRYEPSSGAKLEVLLCRPG